MVLIGKVLDCRKESTQDKFGKRTLGATDEETFYFPGIIIKLRIGLDSINPLSEWEVLEYLVTLLVVDRLNVK